MVGSGRTEIAEVLFGLKNHEKGEIIFENEELSPKGPADVINRGIYLIPEDAGCRTEPCDECTREYLNGPPERSVPVLLLTGVWRTS